MISYIPKMHIRRPAHVAHAHIREVSMISNHKKSFKHTHSKSTRAMRHDAEQSL